MGFLLTEMEFKHPETKSNRIGLTVTQVVIQQTLNKQFISKNEEMSI